ncbi:hypothetical protein Glove_29g91 [Diversispora epigaea]|uniref:Uncharacterized protein n=1 Tax=Diversispora epigaea TaxID=1348612 RepID=A0A397JIQ5_9GLOM|nr:hypothetical protein Glove_29g91 [Diversispora epigaea]
MADTQSKVDTLEEQNSKLIAENDILKRENTEIKSENIELKAENVKLKQALEEHESRFIKLEQNDKDTASENAKLKARVAKLEQKQLQTDEEKSNHIILRSNGRASSADAPASKSDDDTREIRSKGAVLNDHQPPVNITSIETENSNDAPEQTNLHCDDTLATNMSDNTSNSGVHQELSSQYPASPIRTESKSLEDKEMDDFHDSIYEERVSKEIIERIREKKLRDQEASSGKLDSSSGELEELMPPPLSCDMKTTSPKESIQNISQKSIGNSAEASTYVPSEVVRGLLQGFLLNSIEGENIEIINSEPSNSAPAELAYLLYQASKARKKSIKAKQEEILSWGRYSEKYEDRFIKLISENKNLKDKTARTQIYNEMKPYLAGISDEYLRKITSKARKILKLFGWEYDTIAREKVNGIGWHMVKQVTCSADTISRLTNIEIQYIIDQVTSAQVDMSVLKTVNTVYDQKSKSLNTEVSASSSDTKKTLPENEVSISIAEQWLFEPTESHVSDSSKAEVDVMPKKVSSENRISVSASPSCENKTRPPISVLPEDPEEKQKHVIKMALEQIPSLSLKYSNEYGDYFTCLEICPICNRDHKKENIKDNVKGD